MQIRLSVTSGAENNRLQKKKKKKRVRGDVAEEKMTNGALLQTLLANRHRLPMRTKTTAACTRRLQNGQNAARPQGRRGECDAAFAV